jgi:hypothetical protein
LDSTVGAHIRYQQLGVRGYGEISKTKRRKIGGIGVKPKSIACIKLPKPQISVDHVRWSTAW